MKTVSIQFCEEADKKNPGIYGHALMKGFRDNMRKTVAVPDDFDFEKRDIDGLGDLISVVAQPVARLIDKIAGTNLETCGGCKGRRDALNNAMPFHKTTLDNRNKGANSPPAARIM